MTFNKNYYNHFKMFLSPDLKYFKLVIIVYIHICLLLSYNPASIIYWEFRAGWMVASTILIGQDLSNQWFFVRIHIFLDTMFQMNSIAHSTTQG